jgi:CheY-like chemotaxis protein
MPALDGVALQRRLAERHPRARYILMTAYTEDHRLAHALDAGVCRVLTKPFSIGTMLEELGSEVRS